MKTPNRLLYLSAHHLTAHLWRSGELISEGQFPATEPGYRQFAEYLDQNAGSVFSILANVAEEGFHIETIPFLQGSDRKAVIDRKLGQLFYNASLTAAQSLGYEKGQRKDERVLLAALTNNALFAPWLETLHQSGAALSGIHSLPLVLPSLLRKLRIAEEHCLVLTVQDQSIRQSYFDKGELHFSRLTPLQNSSIGGIAQTFAAESLKLQQYLSSQRLIGRNQPITAHILAHSSIFKAIQGSCISSPTIQYQMLSIEECARKTGLATVPAGTHCETLFLNLLMTAPPRMQFANDEQRHGYHLRKIRSGLQGAGALVLLGCLLFSGKLLFDAYAVRQEAATYRSEATLYRQRYEDIARTFPPIPTSNETLRRIIDRYAELDRKSISPAPLFLEISRALHAAPAADLDALDWKIGGTDTATTAATGTSSPGISVPAGSEAVVLRGTLKLGANANARQMLNAFNVFLDALKANPKLQIEVLQRPFDIESGKSLKGGDITLEDNKPRTFSVHVMRKIGS